MDSNGARFFVLLSPISIAILNASPFKDGLYLNRVNVPKHYLGRGIGSALMQAFLEAARTTNFKYVIVEPGGYEAADQDRRVRWYEKHGFIKQEKGYYRLDLSQQQEKS